MFKKPKGQRHTSRDETTPNNRVFREVSKAHLAILVLVFVVVGVLALQVRESLQSMQDAASMASCGNAAVFLLDLQKPLAPEHTNLPGQLLRDVTLDLPADTELAVYALADYAEAPRILLGKLCKPYSNEELAVDAAKDGTGDVRDCDNLPAQVDRSVRDGAKLFCERRNALAERIDLLVGQARSATVSSAYLIEAIEETGRDFQRRTGSKSLYVFSDMMQHASWFSHIETGPSRWDAESFANLRRNLSPQAQGGSGIGAGAEVTVFYLPHAELTASSPEWLAHQEFWKAYFNEAEVTFAAQAPMLNYVVEPQMDVPTEAELMAQERERIRYERVTLAHQQADLERAQQKLAVERQRLADSERRREAELHREWERLRTQEAALNIERERLAQLALPELALPVIDSGH